MDKRLSIYVSSPDSYSDVLAVFLKGYRRYWSDCPYEFILTTNTKSYEGITCICNNKQNDRKSHIQLLAVFRLEMYSPLILSS